MMGKTHLLIGGASWLAGYAALATFHQNNASYVELAGGWAIAVVGALAPDIDSPKSLITQSLGPITKALYHVVSKIGAIGDPHGGYMKGHRRVTHSLLGLLFAMIPFLLGVAFWHLQPWVMYAFGVGWVSHILADMLTKWGCPLLWPKDDCYGLKWIKTGTVWEPYVIRPASIFFSVVMLVLAIGIV